jgi:hypothetical protein
MILLSFNTRVVLGKKIFNEKQQTLWKDLENFQQKPPLKKKKF